VLKLTKENMHKIQIANILLTRRCNLRCNYCSIVRNYKDQPVEYPDINYYRDNELESYEWIEILDKLACNNPSIFFIFYGGEPFLYQQLNQIIVHCKIKHYNYTIISNNTPEVQPLILDLYKKVGRIDGFTASIDPELYLYLNHKETSKDHAVLKSINGFNNLKSLKDKNIVADAVAEITVTSKNYQYLYETIKVLSDAEIYSSITTIDMKQNKFYDFSTVDDQELLVSKNEEIAKIFMDIMADKSLLVHIPHILIDLYKILPCNLKCDIYKDLHNVTIDSDGSFRLCLRIRGTEASRKLENTYSIMDSNGEINKEFLKDLEFDYREYCRGCNWTCMMMSSMFSNSIKNH